MLQNEHFWHGQGCSLFDAVHPAFLLPTTALSTLQDALKDGVGEAVMTYVTCLNHMSFHLLTIVRRGSCGSTRKLLLLCTQLLLVFLLQVPDVEKFLFPESASRVHVSQQQRRMEVTRDLYTLNLLAKLVAPPYPV